MTPTEKQLTDAIKALPGHQVFNGNGCVIIARSSKIGVHQRSVWLGRSSTVDNLQAVLSAAKGV